MWVTREGAPGPHGLRVAARERMKHRGACAPGARGGHPGSAFFKDANRASIRRFNRYLGVSDRESEGKGICGDRPGRKSSRVLALRRSGPRTLADAKLCFLVSAWQK